MNGPHEAKEDGPGTAGVGAAVLAGIPSSDEEGYDSDTTITNASHTNEKWTPEKGTPEKSSHEEIWQMSTTDETGAREPTSSIRTESGSYR